MPVQAFVAMRGVIVDSPKLYRCLEVVCVRNGYTESFIGNLRDELLNREIFTMPVDAKILPEE